MLSCLAWIQRGVQEHHTARLRAKIDVITLSWMSIHVLYLATTTRRNDPLCLSIKDTTGRGTSSRNHVVSFLLQDTTIILRTELSIYEMVSFIVRPQLPETQGLTSPLFSYLLAWALYAHGPSVPPSHRYELYPPGNRS